MKFVYIFFYIDFRNNRMSIVYVVEHTERKYRWGRLFNRHDDPVVRILELLPIEQNDSREADEIPE